MSNHGSCACAGILLLPHSTRQDLRRVRARLAGARTTPRCLLHAVRRWRLRGTQSRAGVFKAPRRYEETDKADDTYTISMKFKEDLAETFGTVEGIN